MRAQDKRRPAWWSPEVILSLLQEGEYVGKICERAQAELAESGYQIGLQQLRQEIGKWSETASLGEALKSALSLWRSRGLPEPTLSKGWYDEFFHAMEQAGGDGKKAAEMVGVGYGLVLSVTDRRNKKLYDPEFAERFRAAEMERVGVVREKYFAHAIEGDNFKVQEKILQGSLPHLHGARQEVHVSGRVEHEHEHGLAPGLMREVIAASQARTSVLLRGREQAQLPEARPAEKVIDITRVRQRSEA